MSFEQAVQHHTAGRLAEAEPLYRAVLAADPNHVGALANLGLLAGQVGQHAAAAELLGRAVSLAPDHQELRANLGVALRNVANAMLQAGRINEAVEQYQQSLKFNPNNSAAWCNLAAALIQQTRFAEAESAARSAIALASDLAEAHNNLGNALRCREQFEAAIAAYQQAVWLRPDYSDAHSNLGIAQREIGDLSSSIESCERAIALTPNSAEAHFSLGISYLLNGNLAEGWPEYDWRFGIPAFAHARRSYPQPEWDGSPLNGRRLLIYDEQGLGDTIQFMRYAALLAQGGERVLIECQPVLKPLLSSIPGLVSVHARGEPLGPFDVHCPVMRLPLLLKTTEQTIPAHVPYLHPDPTEIEYWNQRLVASENGARPLRVGLCWATSAPNQLLQTRNRSIPFSALAPLAELSDVAFYSLQQGESSAVSAPWVTDWTTEFKGFRDAAFIMNLDVVITVDTATAHLAGALGRPGWVLLPMVPDWRWQMRREDSPWYPTARLFRKTKRGDWHDVVQRVIEALRSRRP